MVISSQVSPYPVKPLPFEHHPGMPEKQAPGEEDQGTIGNDTHMTHGLLVH